MNTLARSYTQTTETFRRRFTREQLVLIFDSLKELPRTLLDAAPLVEQCDRLLRALRSEKEPVLAELRKFTGWEAACFQLWLFAFFDDYGKQSPFDSWSYAFAESRHTRAYYVLHEVAELVVKARQSVEATQIASWTLDEARKRCLEAEAKLFEAMDEN